MQKIELSASHSALLWTFLAAALVAPALSCPSSASAQEQKIGLSASAVMTLEEDLGLDNDWASCTIDASAPTGFMEYTGNEDTILDASASCNHVVGKLRVIVSKKNGRIRFGVSARIEERGNPTNYTDDFLPAEVLIEDGPFTFTVPVRGDNALRGSFEVTVDAYNVTFVEV